MTVVGNNMKTLEIAEADATQRIEVYEENIKDLTDRLTEMEDRAETSEKQAHELQQTADEREGIISICHVNKNQ